MLAGSFEDQWCYLFWCSFCIHMGKKFQKSTLPTLFYFVRVRADLQPHVIFWIFFLLLLRNSYYRTLNRSCTLLFEHILLHVHYKMCTRSRVRDLKSSIVWILHQYCTEGMKHGRILEFKLFKNFLSICHFYSLIINCNKSRYRRQKYN